MKLIDMYCRWCGEITRDVLLKGKADETIYCSKCRIDTDHYPVCNGGTKSRYRFADIPSDRRWFRQYVSHHTVEGGTEDLDAKTETPASVPRTMSPDAIAIKKDKLYFKNDKERGHAKIWSK